MIIEFTLQDVADVVANEGLSYAITDYMSSDVIKDKELRKLWDQAYRLLTKIEKILEPYAER